MLTQTKQTNALALTTEAAQLCRQLSSHIEELVEVKQYAEQTYDLDTFTDCHFEIERLSRLWKQADARYSRRLNKI